MGKSGKVCLVTGASSGLGKSLALDAARRGLRVALLARRRDLLRALERAIAEDGGEALCLPADIRQPGDVAAAFAALEAEWGRLDVLINNAGVVDPVAPLVKASDEDLLAALLTNVFGLYLTTREALKRMIALKTEGTIINITSGAAIHPYAGWCAYGSQKAAVDMFTRIAALEAAGHAIRVIAVSPGTFESAMQETIRCTAPGDFPAREKFIALHEAGQLNDPATVARTLIDIALSAWPELSGRVVDLRSEAFRKECQSHGIEQ
jgi:NAD(P)-dependent dehydrogenase (short-subunit alcohol dehydrogenase family)